MYIINLDWINKLIRQYAINSLLALATSGISTAGAVVVVFNEAPAFYILTFAGLLVSSAVMFTLELLHLLSLRHDITVLISYEGCDDVLIYKHKGDVFCNEEILFTFKHVHSYMLDGVYLDPISKTILTTYTEEEYTDDLTE